MRATARQRLPRRERYRYVDSRVTCLFKTTGCYQPPSNKIRAAYTPSGSGARAILPGLLKRNAGAIINIASVMALHSLPITTLYSATKAYLLSLSRGLQGEVAGTGVRVQAVLPAGTATEFYDQAGIPLSAFDPAAVMTTENLVDAALAGFDQCEEVTLPSVHNHDLWAAYDEARAILFGATQVGIPALRTSGCKTPADRPETPDLWSGSRTASACARAGSLVGAISRRRVSTGHLQELSFRRIFERRRPDTRRDGVIGEGSARRGPLVGAPGRSLHTLACCCAVSQTARRML